MPKKYLFNNQKREKKDIIPLYPIYVQYPRIGDNIHNTFIENSCKICYEIMQIYSRWALLFKTVMNVCKLS